MRLFKYSIVLFLLLLLFLLAKMDSIILSYNKAKIVNSSINIDTLYNRLESYVNCLKGLNYVKKGIFTQYGKGEVVV